MQPLDRELRRKLETAVKNAREIAERGAYTALEQLGVGAPKAPLYLTEPQRELRRRLRVHGRQLGDERNSATDAQGIDVLAEEVAYQHWHRMLFARFLAESSLLMYPDPNHPVPVTLEDCAELAADEGAADAWELAARYAARMLPQIFRPTSPVFALVLPPEHQQALEKLLEGLAPEVFTASDSMGWVYQFWQSKKKDEVNDSEVKIGARELPAVTQLFTEPYMVAFLLDNALGAWWVGCVARRDDPAAPELRPGARAMLRMAESEAQLREFFALEDVPLTYLQFVREEHGNWRPAAGWFEGWPLDLAEFKMLDPCCGSGHFLVAVLLMLAAMRRELERLTPAEAVDVVIRQNLHGLEIDERCVEIAAFAVAFTAWRFPEAGGYRLLPPVNLACSGLAIGAKKEDWLALAQQAADEIMAEQAPSLLPEIGKESLWHTQLRAGMSILYDLFQDAPVLGSLINPNRIEGDFFRADYRQVASLLQQILAEEDQLTEQYEISIVAQGLAKAAFLLAGQYDWVVTNVPYLTGKRHIDTLRLYCIAMYPKSRHDLATAFLERCLEACGSGGNVSIVLPQNWLYLSSYEDFRRWLLSMKQLLLIVQLGAGAFESISGEVVKAILLSVDNIHNGQDGRLTTKEEALVDNNYSSLDVSSLPSAREKADFLTVTRPLSVLQYSQLDNPDARITSIEVSQHSVLAKFAMSMRGIVSGDNDRWVRKFWEMPLPVTGWRTLQSTPARTSHFSGREHIVDWRSEGAGMLRPGTKNEAYGKKGVAIAQMAEMPATLYDGSLYDNNTGAIVPYDSRNLTAIWCFCSSPDYRSAIRVIDRKLNVTNATLVKVPFDLDHWTHVASEKYPDGLPKPYTTDPTQWIFHGFPADSNAPLQVAAGCLVGYRWPVELDGTVAVSSKARAWALSSGKLLRFADKDGIVCLPPLSGEFSAAERMVALLTAAYGELWTSDTLNGLLVAVGWVGKSLDTYLRDQFFTDHCRLFQQRPFIWHIWDGLRDGFAALVNYHKLDRKNLETLIYNYLGDWIKLQKQQIGQVDGAQARLAAAETLQIRLELILHGGAPYDIFVRWKPLDQQPIGWHPDLNDGVRLNIRPFMSVPDVGKRGAGVLRDKPSISWNKDRGQDVPSAPWYGAFKGERINDYSGPRNLDSRNG